MQPVGEHFLKQALALALQSIESGGGPSGAVLVKDGAVIATGKNQVVAHADPTAHAEIIAIRAACEALHTHVLRGCTLYSSCEPCPMCLAAIYWARIDRVYYALTRSDAARVGFSDSLIYYELTVEPSKRALPMHQVKIPGADEVFKVWQTRTDRVMY